MEEGEEGGGVGVVGRGRGVGVSHAWCTKRIIRLKLLAGRNRRGFLAFSDQLDRCGGLVVRCAPGERKTKGLITTFPRSAHTSGFKTGSVAAAGQTPAV